MPVVVHAVANRALAARSHPVVPPNASVRLITGKWLTVHAAPLHADPEGAGTVAVTLAPATVAELEPLRLALHGQTPREREAVQLLTRGCHQR